MSWKVFSIIAAKHVTWLLLLWYQNNYHHVKIQDIMACWSCSLVRQAFFFSWLSQWALIVIIVKSLTVSSGCWWEEITWVILILLWFSSQFWVMQRRVLWRIYIFFQIRIVLLRWFFFFALLDRSRAIKTFFMVFPCKKKFNLSLCYKMLFKSRYFTCLGELKIWLSFFKYGTQYDCGVKM